MGVISFLAAIHLFKRNRKNTVFKIPTFRKRSWASVENGRSLTFSKPIGACEITQMNGGIQFHLDVNFAYRLSGLGNT